MQSFRELFSFIGTFQEKVQRYSRLLQPKPSINSFDTRNIAFVEVVYLTPTINTNCDKNGIC